MHGLRRKLEEVDAGWVGINVEGCVTIWFDFSDSGSVHALGGETSSGVGIYCYGKDLRMSESFHYSGAIPLRHLPNGAYI